jgi:hypothetical protein
MEKEVVVGKVKNIAGITYNLVEVLQDGNEYRVLDEVLGSFENRVVRVTIEPLSSQEEAAWLKTVQDKYAEEG